MIPPLTRAEVEALPDLGPWHVGACPSHSPGGQHYRAGEPTPTCVLVRDQDGRRVGSRPCDTRPVIDLQAAAPALRATALALFAEVERLRAEVAVYEAGGSWPSDLGEPLRCGTLAALAAPPQTGILEWRDGLPVRPADGRAADVDRAGWVPLREAGAICNRALPTMRAWVRHGRIKGIRENPEDPASRVLVELAAVLRVAAELDRTVGLDAIDSHAPGCWVIGMTLACHVGRWLLSRGPEACPGDDISLRHPESPLERWSGMVIIDARWSGIVSVVEGDAALRAGTGPRRRVIDRGESVPAVIGVVAGSWTDELAARIPNGARVLIMASFDREGDKCAAAIAATLVKKCQVRRWNP